MSEEAKAQKPDRIEVVEVGPQDVVVVSFGQHVPHEIMEAALTDLRNKFPPGQRIIIMDAGTTFRVYRPPVADLPDLEEFPPPGDRWATKEEVMRMLGLSPPPPTT